MDKIQALAMIQAYTGIGIGLIVGSAPWAPVSAWP